MINILYLHAGAEMYGADVILLNILKNIDTTKFNPIVILPNDGPLVEEINKIGIQCHIIEYPILRRQYFNPKGIISYISTYFSSCKKIKSYLEKNKIKIDVIHSNTAAVLEGIYLKNTIKAKLIFHVHEMIENPKFLRIFFSYVFKMFGDATLCVSNAVKNHLNQDTINKKVAVIHNGISTEIFNNNYDQTLVMNLKHELNIPIDKLVVGMIGRVNAVKGQDDLLQAFEQAYVKNNNLHLLLVGGVFAGQEWRYNELKEIVDKLNLKYGEIITLSDFRKDNYLVHNVIDIFVLPSVQYDSFPTVVLEALATSKAVVAYNCGGVVEMIEDKKNGRIIEWHNIARLSDTILEISLDNELLKKYGEEGLRTITEKFSINSQLQNTEHLYMEVIG